MAKGAQGSKSYIGLKNIVYSKLLVDEEGGLAEYGPIKNLAPAKTASITPSSTNTPEHADDGVLDVIGSNGPVTLSLGTAGIEDEVIADLLGAKYDDGGIEYHKDRISPFVAVGYKSLRADGTYQYMWLLKGKFSNPSQERNTKEDTATPQSNTLEGTFIDRKSDGLQYHTLDTGKASEEKVADYFKSVYKSTTEESVPEV